MRKFIFTILLSLTSIFSFGQEAHWLFNNSTADEKGNHSLVSKSYADYTTSYKIEGTHAANFATDVGARYITSNKVDLSSGGMTINFWVPDYGASGYTTILVTNKTTTTSQGFAVRIDYDNSRIELVTTNSGGTSGSAYSANNSITYGYTSFVSIRMMDVSAQYAKIFINGVQSGTDSTAQAGGNVNDTISIGSYRNGTYTCYTYIDNMSIYKCALTDAQIADIYDNQTSNYEVFCGCELLDGGTIGSDQSGTSGYNLAAFTSSEAASGGDGASYTYKWQFTLSPGGGIWTDIGSSNSATHDYGTITASTYFRRQVVSCAQTAYSNTISCIVTDSYSPTVGLHANVKLKGGDAAKPKFKGGGYAYFRIKGATGTGGGGDMSSLPYKRFIFYEPFTTVSDPTSQAQQEEWNMCIGCFDNTQISVVNAGGSHGNVLKVDFKTDDSGGSPLCNTYLMLDSVYHYVWLQYDVLYSAGFDFTGGGKTFGSFVGGEQVDMDYLGDSLTGFNSLKIFDDYGNIDWYDYTQDVTHPGWPLSASVRWPSNSHAGAYVGETILAYNNTAEWSNSGAVPRYVGKWHGVPSRIDWNGSAYDWASEGHVGTSVTGWQRINALLDLSSDASWNDVDAYYINGVCTYVKDDIRFRIAANVNRGVEAIYINAFFGGATQHPTKDEYIYVDNLTAYVIGPSNPDFETPYVGHTITTYDTTAQIIPISPATPKDERYTDQSGTIYSNNYNSFHFMPNYMTVTKTVSVAGATTYNITMQHFGWIDQTYDALEPNLKIYRYNSGVATLVKEYSTSDHTLTTHNITADSVTFVYYTGGKPNWRTGGEWGFKASYTSNGLYSVGNNPLYPLAQDMVATKPEE
jgi:hypothetical protein